MGVRFRLSDENLAQGVAFTVVGRIKVVVLSAASVQTPATSWWATTVGTLTSATSDPPRPPGGSRK